MGGNLYCWPTVTGAGGRCQNMGFELLSESAGCEHARILEMHTSIWCSSIEDHFMFRGGYARFQWYLFFTDCDLSLRADGFD